VTLEIRKNAHLLYPNFSGALAAAGGLVFVGLMDGTIAVSDDTTQPTMRVLEKFIEEERAANI
jgi:hypothetical protein